MSKRNHPFNISISDGWCEYVYAFSLSKNMCVNDVAKKIAKALKRKPVNGVLRTGKYHAQFPQSLR